jgi:hypothetical protein
MCFVLRYTFLFAYIYLLLEINYTREMKIVVFLNNY